MLETRPLLFQRAATQAHGSRGADRSPDSLGFRCATGENYSPVAQDFYPVAQAPSLPGCAGSLTPRLRSPGQPSRRLPPSDARVARVPVAGKPCRGVAWRGRGLAWLGAAWRGEGHNVGCTHVHVYYAISGRRCFANTMFRPSQTRACTVVPRSAARTLHLGPDVGADVNRERDCVLAPARSGRRRRLRSAAPAGFLDRGGDGRKVRTTRHGLLPSTCPAARGPAPATGRPGAARRRHRSRGGYSVTVKPRALASPHAARCPSVCGQTRTPPNRSSASVACWARSLEEGRSSRR